MRKIDNEQNKLSRIDEKLAKFGSREKKKGKKNQKGNIADTCVR